MGALGMLMGCDRRATSPPPSPPFTPADVTSGTLQLALQRNTAFFEDVGGTSPALNYGDAVKRWNDQSGGAHNAVLNVGTDGSLVLADVSGWSALRCDGNQGLLTSCNLVEPYTIYILGRSLSAAAGSTRMVQATGENALLSFNRSSGLSCYLNGMVSNYATGDTDPHVAELIVDGASTYTLDGVDRTDDHTPHCNWTGFAIGTGGQFAEFAVANIAAIYGFSGHLSATDRANMLTYLQQVPVPTREVGRWVRQSSPIITPTLPTEGTAVIEPTVLTPAQTGADWLMIYTGVTDHGSNSFSGILHYAKSTDGLTWTDKQPVLGGGYSSIAGDAYRPHIVATAVGGPYVVFYADSTTIWTATSTDGKAWTDPVALLVPDALSVSWQNTGTFFNGVDWDLWATYRQQLVDGGLFVTAHLTAPALRGPYTVDQATLPALQQNGTLGVYGSCRVKQVGSQYAMWYHAAFVAGQFLPDQIYRMVSTDRRIWTAPETGTVIPLTAPAPADQVADVDVQYHAGIARAYYDTDQNTEFPYSAFISMATFAGTLAQLIA